MQRELFVQAGFDVRVDWGGDGLAALADQCAVLVIVDVLSFSTSVDIATGRGGRVLPVRWRDERGIEAARRAGAIPAGEGPWTLRPASLVELPAGTFLALPSPNGATLCATAAGSGATVFAGCLRNAGAVARAARAVAGEGSIGVIAAGERWGVTGGPLRPCVEDLLGAGAVVAALTDNGGLKASPEAEIAAGAYRAARDRLDAVLAECASGRELTAAGHRADVTLAAQVASSDVAPRLIDGVLEASR